MDWFLRLAFLFFIGSVLGWVIELLFRRIFTAKKWINPGFLVGPYLPLYGFGLCGLYLLSNINLSFIENVVLQKIIIILIMAVVMTLIEYIAGIIFIKGMKVKLWDYSTRWGNIQGIICPLFSVLWAMVGAIYYFFINPYIQNAVNWLSENLAFSFVIGLFFGVIIIDVFYSMKILSSIKKFAKENKIVVKYEKLKETVKEYISSQKQKYHFILAFKSTETLKKHLIDYKKAIQSKFDYKNQKNNGNDVKKDNQEDNNEKLL